jgi:hypothetical protein
MLSAVPQKVYRFAFSALVSFLVLLNILLASPVLAGDCAGGSSCG